MFVTTFIVFLFCNSLLINLALTEEQMYKVVAETVEPSPSYFNHPKRDHSHYNNANQDQILSDNAKHPSLTAMTGQKWNVSGVLTIHGLASNEPTCQETMKNLVTSICLPDENNNNGHRAKRTSGQLPVLMNQMLEMGTEFINSNLLKPDDDGNSDISVDIYKRSPFDPKFIQSRIQLITKECCSGRRKCTVTYVKEQIEDACRPGRMSGTRNVFNA